MTYENDCPRCGCRTEDCECEPGAPFAPDDPMAIEIYGTDEQRSLLRTESIEKLIGLAEEMMGYVPTYFVEKWGMQDRLDELKGILSKTPGSAH